MPFAKNNPIIFFSCLILAGVLSPGGIAFGDTESESNVWFMSLSRFRFDKRIQGFLDIQPRTAIDSETEGADGEVRQLLTRGAIGYDLTDKITLFQGYALIANYEPTRIEHRSFQELLIRNKFSESSLTHRIRFEQRFLENISGVSLRGRYFLRFMKPITEKFSFVSNEEAFFHLNDRSGGPQAGFDQNRFFLGLNHKIGDQVSVDFGYQNQYIERRGSSTDSLNHIIFFGLLSSFDF